MDADRSTEMTARQALTLAGVLLEGIPKGLSAESAQSLIRDRSGTKWRVTEALMDQFDSADQVRLLGAKVEQTEIDLEYNQPIKDLIRDGKYDKVSHQDMFQSQPCRMNSRPTHRTTVYLLTMRPGVSGWLAVRTAWLYGRPATLQELLQLGIQQPERQLPGRLFGLGQTLDIPYSSPHPHYAVLRSWSNGSHSGRGRALDDLQLIETWKNDQFLIIPH